MNGQAVFEPVAINKGPEQMSRALPYLLHLLFNAVVLTDNRCRTYSAGGRRYSPISIAGVERTAFDSLTTSSMEPPLPGR